MYPSLGREYVRVKGSHSSMSSEAQLPEGPIVSQSGRATSSVYGSPIMDAICSIT